MADAPRDAPSPAPDAASGPPPRVLSLSDLAALTDEALLAECEIDTLRAGTKGGQRANKVETGIRLRHLPSGTIVVARRQRSQAQNRAFAIAELRRRLEDAARPETPRVATRPTAGSRRRHADAKRHRAATKAHRRYRQE